VTEKAANKYFSISCLSISLGKNHSQRENTLSPHYVPGEQNVSEPLTEVAAWPPFVTLQCSSAFSLRHALQLSFAVNGDAGEFVWGLKFVHSAVVDRRFY
jgi:hypothetical protein